MIRKFFIILLFPLLCASIGIGSAHFMPTQWQISVNIAPPKINELGNYFSLFSTYSLISGDADAADMSKREEKIGKNAYQQFLKHLNSTEKRITFFAQSESLKKQANIKKITPEQIAQQFSAQFQVNQEAIRFSSFDLKTLETLFASYLREINQQTKDELNNELINQWRTLFQQVKNAADAKLDASWDNKLKMMQSVQPLDNKLVAFRFEQNPHITALPQPYIFFGCAGAAFGLLLSLLALLILGGSRKK